MPAFAPQLSEDQGLDQAVLRYLKVGMQLNQSSHDFIHSGRKR
jgi:hypothetical protein